MKIDEGGRIGSNHDTTASPTPSDHSNSVRPDDGTSLQELGVSSNSSLFRDTQPQLLRTTGQKGGTRRALPRLGAWALLKSPPSESECLEALRQISVQEWADERQRVDQHRQRFQFEARSVKSADAQLARLLQQWLAIPKKSPG